MDSSKYWAMQATRPNRANMQRLSEVDHSATESVSVGSVWQDAADDEEWSAWMDGATQESASVTDEHDEFGAWVDSSDPDDSLQFQTPASSPYFPTEHVQESNVTRPLQLEQLDILELNTRTFAPQSTHIPSIPTDCATSLYNNPWDDDRPVSDQRRLQDREEHEDDYDIDPEMDSALASSAWESVLAQDRKSVEHHSNDEEATFEAWNVEDQTDFRGASTGEEVSYKLGPQLASNPYELGTNSNSREPSEQVLEWYATDFGATKEAEARRPTWMQRLTGNRRKNQGDNRGR